MGEASSFSTDCSAAWGVPTEWRTQGRTLLPSPHPHRWSLPGAVGASTSLSPNVMCHNVLTFRGAPLAHLHGTPHCTDGETEAGWVTAHEFLLLFRCCFQLISQGQCASSTLTSCRDGIHKPKPNSSTNSSHRQSSSQWIWVPAKV